MSGKLLLRKSIKNSRLAAVIVLLDTVLVTASLYSCVKYEHTNSIRIKQCDFINTHLWLSRAVLLKYDTYVHYATFQCSFMHLYVKGTSNCSTFN